nr:MAG TPA: hypothetical protein [Caudoviricetes sp.]
MTFKHSIAQKAMKIRGEKHEKQSMESGNKSCLRGKTFSGIPFPAPWSNRPCRKSGMAGRNLRDKRRSPEVCRRIE